jgi:hypothetical protein
MTLDELIAKCLEAKEHCVPGNSEVNIWFSDVTSLTGKDKFVGSLYWIDYDNIGINLYYDNL